MCTEDWSINERSGPRGGQGPIYQFIDYEQCLPIHVLQSVSRTSGTLVPDLEASSRPWRSWDPPRILSNTLG